MPTVRESSGVAMAASPSGAGYRSRRAALARRFANDGIAVGALTVAMAAIYSTFSIFLYYTFNTDSWDLTIFDQAIESYAHFGPGISIIKGMHIGAGPNFSVLGDHWSPILVTLAPLYWIDSSPVNLLVAQAVLFALAIPPLWVYTRRACGRGRRATAAAYLVSVAYVLSWPIASAAAFDFHEVAFVPVLTAVALERLQAGRLRPALFAVAGLLLVKEDMGLLVAGLGCYLAACRPRFGRQRLVGLALIAGGLAYSALAEYVLIPAMGGRADYYWAYDALGKGVPQAAWHLITHPLSSLKRLATPGTKLRTIFWLFAAFCFLPLLSPLLLAAVPLLLERMMADKFPTWWGIPYQYNAFLVMILICAAVDGAVRLGWWTERGRIRILAWRDRERGRSSRLRPPRLAVAATSLTWLGRAALRVLRRLARAGSAPWRWLGQRVPVRPLLGQVPGNVQLAATAAMCVLACCLVPSFALGAALNSRFYHRTDYEKAAAAAIGHVPSGVVVAAANNVGPQLSPRDTVLLWEGGTLTSPVATPWVVADVARREFTFRSVAAEKARVAFLEQHGYRDVFSDGGYYVLHRPGPALLPTKRRKPVGHAVA